MAEKKTAPPKRLTPAEYAEALLHLKRAVDGGYYEPDQGQEPRYQRDTGDESEQVRREENAL